AIALPAYQDYTIRAYVAEGLVVAEGAKAAFMDYWVENGKTPLVGYPGTGKAPKDSYRYEFKSTRNVEKIAICTPYDDTGVGSDCWPAIRIFYGGKNKKLKEIGIVVALVPGYGKINPITGNPEKNLMPEKGTPSVGGGSIVWGCRLSDQTKLKSFRKVGKYMPARCRYKYIGMPD
ncbi:MAG: pilin, partial [Zoogloeaceae bacterium]|nr:pilin [Zoogloeaceae bacterium]